MKASVKKKKPVKISTLQNKLWELCKQITRIRHGRYCFTCGRGPLEGLNWQTGHFIAKAACPAILKYELDGLRPQCFSCNINRGGMGAVFYRELLKKEGQEYVDRIFAMKNILIKADSIWYLSKIDEYQKILNKEM